MSWALWISGLPGSGKSALARAAAERLTSLGEPVAVLELDEVRRVLTPMATYADGERDVVYRALAWMASALTQAGIPVIVDATAHRRAWRDLARAWIPTFAEVQLVCGLEVREEREARPSGGHAARAISARAGRPGATAPGVDVVCEEEAAPELVIDTQKTDLADAVVKAVLLALRLAAASPSRTPPAGAAWTIWITGRPGSGKTTIARGVAEELTAAGIRFRLLELVAARQALLAADGATEAAEEIVHRALAYTAKLLTEHGMPVLVDATTPRRAWRDLARELIPHFAEVQLVCPIEVCVERERAARWRLGAEAPGAHDETPRGVIPEICFDYEQSLTPDLTLHTHVQGHWSGVEQVLRLARRLSRRAKIHIHSPHGHKR